MNNSNKIKVDKKTEDIWVYQTESANKFVDFILMALLTTVFVLKAIQDSVPFYQVCYLIFFLLIIMISLLIPKKSAVEINMRDKTINTWWKVLSFKNNKIYPLKDFDSIKILQKKVPLEEGYLGTEYSIVISGPAVSKEIASLPDKETAERHLHELATFVNLRALDTIEEHE